MREGGNRSIVGRGGKGAAWLWLLWKPASTGVRPPQADCETDSPSIQHAPSRHVHCMPPPSSLPLHIACLPAA